MSTLITDWRDRATHRRVWALAAPMILSNISVPLVALVDSTVIGHLPHAHQLGAVAVSTRATNGTEIFERIIGAASAQTLIWVGRSRQSVSKRDMEAPGKPAL